MSFHTLVIDAIGDHNSPIAITQMIMGSGKQNTLSRCVVKCVSLLTDLQLSLDAFFAVFSER